MSPLATKGRKLQAASLTGAVVAAIAASACCLVPAALAIFGVSGAGFALEFAPFRPLLLGITGILLAVGFYLTYRKPKTAGIETSDNDACGCAVPRASRAGKVMLWGATIMAVAFAIYPYVAVAGSEKSANHAANAQDAATTTLHIGGMTCEACAGHVTEALKKVDGVISSTVDYGSANATIIYDPRKVTQVGMITAIEAAGYTAVAQERVR